jgi:putative transposase
MTLDADVVAVSPSSAYRVLREAGLMGRRHGKPSLRGAGFVQPARPHEHWHVDVAYINVAGSFVAWIM